MKRVTLRKQYINPEIQVVEMNIHQPLLNESLGLYDIETNTQLSREDIFEGLEGLEGFEDLQKMLF